MKTDLKDITFLILIRTDSIQRLENIKCVIEKISQCFDTNIYVLEVSSYQNTILRRLLKNKIRYEFIRDYDDILYKTQYINYMVNNIKTPFFSLWDVDIIVDKKSVISSACKMREGFDVAYPYNGYCYNVPPVLRDIYLRKKDVRFLYRQMGKMKLLYERLLVGGALFINKEKFKFCGMENENHYGWGNDDFDRYYRFKNLGMSIYRESVPLFHLYHPRLGNTGFRSKFHMFNTNRELFNVENSSREEILNKFL